MQVPLDEIKRSSSFHIRLECKQSRWLEQELDTLQNTNPQVFQENQISLNTTDNLQWKSPHWSTSPSVCCLCRKSEETLDHPSFSTALFARKAWGLVQNEFGLMFRFYDKVNSFVQESFGGSLLKLEFCSNGPFVDGLKREQKEF